MALEMVVESLDGLDEGLKSLYVEKDGKYSLDVNGVEDVTGLKSALEKERINGRAATKALKDMQAKYSGIDVDVVKGLLEQAETDAEAKLIAEGNISQVLEQRIKKHQEETEGRLAEKDGVINTLTRKALENVFRTAASKAGVHPQAIDDVLLRGASLFSLDSNGNAVQLGQDGHPVFGKDGKTPYNPSEWLEGMRETAPHWFPAGNSGGGSQGQGSNAGGKTMTRSTFDSLGPIEKLAFVKDGGIVT